ncbi:MAG TPA: CDGSH iron-sulfur domain-containing protein [Acidimicrobiia bacterium]|nr:CDGSH iron-sulfur domain-containing protein [Acidimicrobiia bacterium]
MSALPEEPSGSDSPSAPTRIRAYPDGPFLIRGDFVIEDAEMGPIEVKRAVVALCRCGRSKQAPLCDGSHGSRRRQG